MSALLTAAQSYYGLADASVRRTEWVTDAGQVIIVFEVAPTDDEIIGIVERMKALRDAHPMSADHQVDETEQFHEMNRERARVMYNSLSDAERSKYGSFARYVAAASIDQDMVAHQREVRHIDVPEPEDSGKPEAVWVPYEDTTPEQWQMRSDQRDKGQLEALIQVVMLTPEQRARYVKPGEQHE